MDFCKAFDTIDRKSLLQNLKMYGIFVTVLKWFKSYPSNRSQVTRFVSRKWTKKDINFGVPQGTLLGPNVSIVYINEIT